MAAALSNKTISIQLLRWFELSLVRLPPKIRKHMQLTPTIAIHMSAAIAALVIGPVVLWARLANTSDRGCTAHGLCVDHVDVGAAISAIIRDFNFGATRRFMSSFPSRW